MGGRGGRTKLRHELVVQRNGNLHPARALAHNHVSKTPQGDASGELVFKKLGSEQAKRQIMS